MRIGGITACIIACGLGFSSASHANSADQCVSMAATQYHLNKSQIESVIDGQKQNPSGIGVMGIPREWLPYLESYGINPGKLDDPCQNIVAGAWIIAYAQQVSGPVISLSARYRHSGKLPARALKWQGVIAQLSRESGVPTNLINAVIMQESGFNEKARSKAGAIGLMQLMPNTARDLGVDPHDSLDNLRGGATYLSQQLSQFNGNLALALAAYNAGPTAVVKYGGVPPYSETRGYVASIMNRVRSPME